MLVILMLLVVDKEYLCHRKVQKERWGAKLKYYLLIYFINKPTFVTETQG